ncbi:MAG: GNAT family N-acetyltransferase [Kiloniellales bacterium]
MHAGCFPAETWSQHDLQSLETLSGSLAWHIEAGNRLLGLLLARHAAGEAEVLTLAVDPTCRRKGLATVMMQTLIEDLRRRGVVGLYLEMARNNDPALALYSNLGFSEVGIRKDYYRDGADAAVLRLAIDKIGETNSFLSERS